MRLFKLIMNEREIEYEIDWLNDFYIENITPRKYEKTFVFKTKATPEL